MAKRHSQLHLVSHPLIQHMLAEARDRRTAPPRFRELLSSIGELLGFEAMRDLATEEVEVRTPLETTPGVRVKLPVTIVPILRAGLGLATGLHRLLPEAQVGHIGMFRDEKRLNPISYFEKLPRNVAKGPVLLADPMLATGGSAIAAVKLLKNHGCKDVRLVCLVVSPEGVARLERAHPDVPIYTAALDRELDERGFILPGLGDAGDRLFGTLE